MNTVSRKEIIDAWTRLCDLDETETDVLVKKFMDEQPALGIYLSANMEEMEGGAEHTRIVELVVAAWQAMSKSAGRQLPAATPEQIERAEDANTRSLEELDEASEFDWENSVRGFLQDYNQPEILGFVIEILMSGNEDAPELAPESIGLEMVWLKTLIDVLDR
jgi:DNA-binding phage protein